MKVHRFHREQPVPAPLAEVFRFFSDARNLALITPPEMGFRILNQGPIEMRAGTRIDYRVRVFGVPIRWTSEITRWEPPRLFSDVQVSGPYKLWEHTHTFEESTGGTRLADEVRYALRFGWPGRLANFAVERNLNRIFEYRRQRIEAMFGKAPR